MPKTFDAVKFMREARERMTREFEGKSFEEQERLLAEAVRRFMSERDARSTHKVEAK